MDRRIALSLAVLVLLAPFACDRQPEGTQGSDSPRGPTVQEQRSGGRASSSHPASAPTGSAPALAGHEGHHHAPKHGGVLVSVGDGAAQVELVLDADKGVLTAHVMDGCAEQPVRIAQPILLLNLSKLRARTDIGDVVDVNLKTSFRGDGAPVRLSAAKSVLSGETPGDSATFDVAFSLLKGAVEFEGVISEISIKGQVYRNVPFRFAPQP